LCALGQLREESDHTQSRQGASLTRGLVVLVQFLIYLLAHKLCSFRLVAVSAYFASEGSRTSCIAELQRRNVFDSTDSQSDVNT
jgi:hypothetical protein